VWAGYDSDTGSPSQQDNKTNERYFHLLKPHTSLVKEKKKVWEVLGNRFLTSKSEDWPSNRQLVLHKNTLLTSI
jgi:hypothetical protein